MTIEGKIAVVTGGSRGIGRAICTRLGSLGCHVWINYVSRSKAAEETVELVQQAAFAINEPIIGYKNPRQFALVLRVKLVEQLLEPSRMALGNGKKDALTGQCAGLVLDALLHELPNDKGIRARVGDFLF